MSNGANTATHPDTLATESGAGFCAGVSGTAGVTSACDGCETSAAGPAGWRSVLPDDSRAFGQYKVTAATAAIPAATAAARGSQGFIFVANDGSESCVISLSSAAYGLSPSANSIGSYG